jgi:hypothetical protein
VAALDATKKASSTRRQGLAVVITESPRLARCVRSSFWFLARRSQHINAVREVEQVSPINDPPVFTSVPGAATVPELTAYTFTALASDVDSPSLTYSLVGALLGAAINPATGQIRDDIIEDLSEAVQSQYGVDASHLDPRKGD